MNDADSGAADPWGVHVTSFRISSAQLTATPLPPSSDELTVLCGTSLVVEEGRYEALRDDDAGAPAPSILEYGCFVREGGAPPISIWIGTDAHIVIVGTHENGSLVTLAGVGAIGRDENGVLEISFERPPGIAVIGSVMPR